MERADDIWNRATTGGGREAREGDLALSAALLFHGAVMSGGVLHAYETLPQARAGLLRYLPFYNERRRHESLDCRTPAAVLNLCTHKTEPPEAEPGLIPLASAVRMFTEIQT